MIDLEAILSGWYNQVSGNKPAKQRAIPRLRVCAECEFLGKGTIFKAKCLKCGCPIQAKALSRVRGCPLNKWEK